MLSDRQTGVGRNREPTPLNVQAEDGVFADTQRQQALCGLPLVSFPPRCLDLLAQPTRRVFLRMKSIKMYCPNVIVLVK